MQVKMMRKETFCPAEISHLSKEQQLVWLMEEYGDMIVRLAYSYVKQKQAAEDISQEVFISCFNSLDRFQKKSSYKTWLYRITVNKCKDYVKSWSYKHIRYKDFFSSILMKNPSPDMQGMDREEKEVIFSKVLFLPIKLREVIIFHYYEEMSVNEISDLLSINSNTVKTRLHRAKKQLKGLLEGDGNDGR
ncbi:RNA polymerase sigma-70 factor (ECF subfamily) [Peribacillus deserti]|uniref:RNA polymerase sigma-70 factor (ECF subfamily) n=1 Tax=Peribacillus deserti TaxID=673318 RepID=A0ABS2QDT5_9BACI|nr:sigma-70 family RNA polymerase sigma factor [Peribacillus deserti]MBM7690844.1 RNA polymerase sigma-70 factor (ECF subfamily) [Peribacillus deserti]